MKKVLVIIGKLKVGGAEKVARDIGFFADKQQFQIDYLVFGNEIGDYEKELEDVGCTIYHFDPPQTNYLHYYSKLKRLIKNEKYDVIHSHTMFSSGWAMMAAKKCGVPIRISHSHTIKGERKRGFIRNSYERIMRRLIQKDSTHYIGCGKSAGEWLFGEKFFKSRGQIIYNGIDLSRYAYDPIKRDAIRKHYHFDDSLVLGHVGHLTHVKNQPYILRLLEDILKTNKNVALFLIGDGQDREMLEKLVDNMNLKDHVIFTGNINNVYDYLNAMDVFVFPSFHEGMPLALIEVQTNGLPCIISDAIPDDIVQTDLVQYCSLDHPETWIQYILSVKRKDAKSYYDKMYQLGFDTEMMLKKIYRLYEG